MSTSKLRSLVLIVILAVGGCAGTGRDSDPLPSWNETDAKAAILDFVDDVTTAGSPDFVPPEERIAVFDNDGTLVIEQPMYMQATFIDRTVRALAAVDRDARAKPEVRAVLDADRAALAGLGQQGLADLVAASPPGLTSERLAVSVSGWLDEARHPRFGRSYTELVYEPMVELLTFLRSKGFKTFIVTGSGVEFMRPWTEAAYGVPPEQVVGSSVATDYVVADGEPSLVKRPEVAFVDDRAGKPEGIDRFIGRRPIAAFGNSDGDLEMLTWVTAGEGRRFGLIVHHDDPVREYRYDRVGPIGRLDAALNAAGAAGWTVVSMANDWSRIFPEPPSP